MNLFRKSIDFIISSSILTAISCVALTRITQIQFNTSIDLNLLIFIFFSTITSYNLIKYSDYISKNQKLSKIIKIIIAITIISSIITAYSFTNIPFEIQIVNLIVLFIIILYTFPIFGRKNNLRNQPRLKSYLVVVCWFTVTFINPILLTYVGCTLKLVLFGLLRTLLLFILMLIFEIIDFKTDPPELKTIPQQIGVSNTKNLSMILIVLFSILGLLLNQTIISIIVMATSLFLAIIYCSKFKSKNNSKIAMELLSVLFWLSLERF